MGQVIKWSRINVIGKVPGPMGPYNRETSPNGCDEGQTVFSAH